MSITDIIKKAQSTLFSFEILPPKKGDTIESIYETIDPLMEFNPVFIDVTYHREEIVYKPRPGGLLERNVVRKRPGTVGISAAIKYKYGVEVVPHIICGGFTREETENALIDLNFLGIKNLLIIRGDNLPGEKSFQAEPNGNNYAIDLINQVMDMNSGKYVDEELSNPSPTSFSFGIAGYPEKHYEAPNFDSDLRHLKTKIDAGAQYIVTQMFFDNNRYYNFVEKCRSIGIWVPIIPGLKPIATKSQISMLPKTFNIDIPEDLVSEVEKCRDNSAVKQIGIEWTLAQSLDLKKNGVPVLHYYSMSRPENIAEVAKKVF